MIQLQPLPLYHNLLIALINVIGITLAFWVYGKNKKAWLNKTFLISSFLMLVWVDFAYIARLIGESNLSLAEGFIKIAWFATPLFFSSLYLLIVNLTEKQKKYKNLTIFILIISLIAAFFTGFSHFIVRGISLFHNTDLRINYGGGIFPFLFIILVFICVSLYILIKAYVKSSGQLRKKIEHFLIGIFIFYLANFVFNIALPIFFGISSFYWIGDYSTIFLLGFISYAIVRHNLFGVKILLTQFLLALFLALLLSSFLSSSSLKQYIWNGMIFLAYILLSYFIMQSILKAVEPYKKSLQETQKNLKSEQRLHREFAKRTGAIMQKMENIVRGSNQNKN